MPTTSSCSSVAPIAKLSTLQQLLAPITTQLSQAISTSKSPKSPITLSPDDILFPHNITDPTKLLLLAVQTRTNQLNQLVSMTSLPSELQPQENATQTAAQANNLAIITNGNLVYSYHFDHFTTTPEILQKMNKNTQAFSIAVTPIYNATNIMHQFKPTLHPQVTTQIRTIILELILIYLSHIQGLYNEDIANISQINTKLVDFDLLVNPSHQRFMSKLFCSDQYHSHQLLVQQFNMLADHLSGSHPYCGNFENIDTQCLLMQSRQWSLLYMMLSGHKVLLPQSYNTNESSMAEKDRQNGEDCEKEKLYHPDVLTLQEMDERFYLTFFGQVFAYCGYHSVYKSKIVGDGSALFPNNNNNSINQVSALDYTSAPPQQEGPTNSTIYSPPNSMYPCDGECIASIYPLHAPQYCVLLQNYSQIALTAFILLPHSHNDKKGHQDHKFALITTIHLKADKTPKGEAVREMQIMNVMLYIQTRMKEFIALQHMAFQQAHHKQHNVLTDPLFSSTNNYNIVLYSILTGDFNAAPCQNTTASYPSLCYPAVCSSRIHIKNPFSTDLSDDNNNMLQSLLHFSSVYSYYNAAYMNYINTAENESVSSMIEAVQPGIEHTLSIPASEGEPARLLTIHEAPYTTMKTRNGKLSQHTIDYIFFTKLPVVFSSQGNSILSPSSSPDDDGENITSNVNNGKSYGKMRVLALGAIPDSHLMNNLPSWSMPSDHMPIFALLHF